MTNPIIYILRFIYRIKYWLILCPLAVAFVVWLCTNDIQREWNVDSTIYTGVVSGFDIESSTASNTSQATINNAMDNIINIISSESTLKRVSMRLFAQHMMYGDSNKDTKYISAKHYNLLYNKVAASKDASALLVLIDKTNEENTIKNLFAYEEESKDNFIFGLFNWTHPHYSHEALKKITIKRLGNSDMLSIGYKTNDPAIAYNTLILLNEEFIKQYEELRFGETNSVIKYFEEELARLKQRLHQVEDEFTEYNTDKLVINYPEQTKYVAAMQRDFDLKYEEILLAYVSSKKLVETIEKRIDYKTINIRNNILYINKMKEITDIQEKISEIESFGNDSTYNSKIKRVNELRGQLTKEENNLIKLSENLINQQYSKEGISSVTLVDQWLTESIRFEKAEAELKVMEKRKDELENKYKFFSPVGSTIKRMEREIGFTEQSYLSVLSSLNAAKLRRKNLQMTSATLKVINPPVFPISPEPHIRKLLVASAFFATFLFLLGVFILLELLDRTLRNKQRTEKLTGLKVIGAIPKKNIIGYRSYDKIWMEMAAQNIANKLMTDFKPFDATVINVISTEYFEGKSQLSEALGNYLEEEGMRVKILTAGDDFQTQSREFHLAASIKELTNTDNLDAIIIEYPPLCSISIPSQLLEEASANILAVRANRSWKDTDQIILEHLKKDTTKLYLVLTEAERLVVEVFTGFLPPHTFMRRLGYRIYQMGLTSKEYFNKKTESINDNE